MSRRREAADLARALLLSTQQQAEGAATPLTSGSDRRSVSLSPPPPAATADPAMHAIAPTIDASRINIGGGGSVNLSKIWALAPTLRDAPTVTSGDGVMSVQAMLSSSEPRDSIAPVSASSRSSGDPSPIISFSRSNESAQQPSADASDIVPLPNELYCPEQSDPPHSSELMGSEFDHSRMARTSTGNAVQAFLSPAFPAEITDRSRPTGTPDSSDSSRPLFSPTQTSAIRNLIAGPGPGLAEAAAQASSPIKARPHKTYGRADRRHSSPPLTPLRPAHSGRSRLTLSSSPISEPLDEGSPHRQHLEDETQESIEILGPLRAEFVTPAAQRTVLSSTNPKSRLAVVLPSAVSIGPDKNQRHRRQSASPDPLDSLPKPSRSSRTTQTPDVADHADPYLASGSSTWQPPSSSPADGPRRVSKRVSDKKEKDERAKEERRRKRREEKERKATAEATAASLIPSAEPAIDSAAPSGIASLADAPVTPSITEAHVTAVGAGEPSIVISTDVVPEAGPSRAKSKPKEKKAPKGKKGAASKAAATATFLAEPAAAEATEKDAVLPTLEPILDQSASRQPQTASAEEVQVNHDRMEDEDELPPVVEAPASNSAQPRESSRSPLTAIPTRLNSPAVRSSPGPKDASGKAIKPGGIQWKTTRSDLSSLLSKFPGSRPTGMSRRHKIVPLHTKIGPPPKRLPPPPPKPVKRKKGDSDDDDDDESEEESDGEGGVRKKLKSKERGIEWFMVED